jgi:hypothetical protein
MSRNLLYAVVGVLAVIVVVLGIALERDREKPPGITIELKNNDVTLSSPVVTGELPPKAAEGARPSP